MKPATQPQDCRLLTADASFQTWRTSRLPACYSGSGLTPDTPPDPRSIFAGIYVGRTFLVTTDGGEHWHPTTPVVPGAAPDFYHLFASQDRGVFTADDPPTLIAMAHASSLTTAYASYDAGASWVVNQLWPDGMAPFPQSRLSIGLTRTIAWASGAGIAVRGTNPLEPWRRLPLLQQGEAFLRPEFVPGTDNLLVQVRDPNGQTTSLCRYTAVASYPFWRRDGCTQLPGLSQGIIDFRFFTTQRFLIRALKQVLLATDDGAIVTDTQTVAPPEYAAAIATITATDAVLFVQGTQTDIAKRLVTHDGGISWRTP